MIGTFGGGLTELLPELFELSVTLFEQPARVSSAKIEVQGASFAMRHMYRSLFKRVMVARRGTLGHFRKRCSLLEGFKAIALPGRANLGAILQPSVILKITFAAAGELPVVVWMHATSQPVASEFLQGTRWRFKHANFLPLQT
jgi:hypothetical protein